MSIGAYNAGFSDFYDTFSDDCDCEKWSQYLLLLLKERGNYQSGLDMACGTGRITRLLARAGYAMTGADISEHMLDAAVKNAGSSGARPVFVKGDLLSFRGHRAFDFVTVVNDGINYLPQEKLARTFKNLYANLVAGGALLLDISTEAKLDRLIAGQTYFDDRDEATLLWHNERVPGGVRMRLVLFERGTGGAYVRHDEEHIQYAHSVKAVSGALELAGFADITAYDCFTKDPPHTGSQRVQFCAVKPSKSGGRKV